MQYAIVCGCMSRTDEDNENTSTPHLHHELNKIRRQNRRSQIDSVHILVAIGIVGWYFTTTRGSLFAFSNTFDVYFLAFTLLSAGYIVLKINLVSIRDFVQRSDIIKFERGISFLFFASLDGIVAIAIVDGLLSWADTTQFRGLLLPLSAAVAIIISLVPSFYYYRLSYSIDKSIQEQELVDLLFKYPEMLQPGFKPKEREWMSRNRGWLQRADIYGIDNEGNETIVNVRTHASEDDVKLLERRVSDSPNMKYIIAALDFSDVALNRVQNIDNIEYREITLGHRSSIRALIKSALDNT